MSSPLNDVLAGFSRKYRKKAKQVEPLIQKYLDEGMLPAHAVDKVLKETDFKAYMTKAVKDAMLSSAVICCHLLSLVPALTLRGNLRHWMKHGTRQG